LLQSLTLQQIRRLKEFKQALHIRWSDLDPNGHVRHSVYYDFAAQLRTELFIANNIKVEDMAKLGIGPILFEEKASFKRELHFGDDLTMTAWVKGLRKDYSRFAFIHEIWRGETLCATVEVLGAWINLRERKLAIPPAEFITKFEHFPLHADFAWMPEKQPSKS
jgi:acyl-CoA thioester hydrolase